MAEIPKVIVDVLVVESTYGCKDHEPRLKRETRFTK
jgi:Cft2 family RNA processing exonuclease